MDNTEKHTDNIPKTSRTARIWAWIIVIIIVAAVAWLFCRSCTSSICPSETITTVCCSLATLW